ncbi:MAG: DUF3179 domain-containing protein [Acidimicrobiia bacterium]|nr:DUF3179 domain-containing protein [Acidimicrobiia bacterium]
MNDTASVLACEVLQQIPASTVSWSTFMKSRPDAKVLDQNRTGFERADETNPYISLDNPNGQPCCSTATLLLAPGNKAYRRDRER